MSTTGGFQGSTIALTVLNPDDLQDYKLIYPILGSRQLQESKYYFV